MYAFTKFGTLEVIVLLREGYEKVRKGEYPLPCSAGLNFQLIPKCQAISGQLMIIRVGAGLRTTLSTNQFND